MKRRIQTLDEYIVERTSSEIPKQKNTWIEINPKDYVDLKDEFFDLIQTAYKEIGGNVKVKNSSDIFNGNITLWRGIDNDAEPDFDAVIGYKQTAYGNKFVIVGTDGTNISKKQYLEANADDLHKKGFYCEVSHKLAEILINKFKVHIVTNPNAIKAVINKPLTFYGKHPTDIHASGDGWYEREIGGQKLIKTLVGRPLVVESVSSQKTILSLHGYESTAFPDRLKILQNEGYNILAPEMNYPKVQNLFKKTYDTYKNEKIDLIVGSSMGGYFGYYLATLLNVPALLFNPAVIDTTSGVPKQEVFGGNYRPKMIVVSGIADNIVLQEPLEEWFKENAKNYQFIKANIAHRVPDEVYISYVKKYI